MTFIIGILFGSFALATIGLKRAYESVSIKELTKRARAGDHTAILLHRSVAYGSSLSFVLWTLICISNAMFFVFIARSSAAWFAAFLTAMVIWFGFIWLPKRKASSYGVWFAAQISPVVAKVASFLYPIVQRVNGWVHRFSPIHIHTGIYDEDDLVNLLQTQKSQPDNQIPDSALEIASYAITYGGVLVREVLVPRRTVRMVQADETTGPVFMDELHKSGFSRFPVYSENTDNIVGILYLRDLVKTKHSGKVKTLMNPEVLFIHEEQTLQDALQAILKTLQHMVIVVNSFEEYVGVLTIEDVFEQILGQQIVDEFDQYEDMRAVASLAAKKDHQERQHPAE